MPSKKISDLTAATALTGTETFEVVQTTSKKATAAQIATYVQRGEWRVLAHSAVAVAHTGTTAETTLKTIALPAGTLGPNGRLRITSLWSATNNANSKTARARLNTSQIFTAIIPSLATVLISRDLANRNSQASQVTYPAGLTTSTGTSTTAVSTFTVDTSAAQDITLTATLANAADTLTLESYLIEYLYGA